MICVFNVYAGYIIHRCGKILPSYSDSWYELPGVEKHLFTLFIIGIAIPMAEIAVDRESWWYFLSAAVLCFVAIATEFKKKNVEPIHVFGASGGIALAFGGMIDDKHYILAGIMLATVILLSCLKIKNKTWWVETACFYSIWIGLKVSPSWFDSFYK